MVSAVHRSYIDSCAASTVLQYFLPISQLLLVGRCTGGGGGSTCILVSFISWHCDRFIYLSLNLTCCRAPCILRSFGSFRDKIPLNNVRYVGSLHNREFCCITCAHTYSSCNTENCLKIRWQPKNPQVKEMLDLMSRHAEPVA